MAAMCLADSDSKSASLALVPFYVVAIVVLGKQLTVMPEARKLIARGPYAVSRHPLYVTYIAGSLSRSPSHRPS